MHEMSPGNVEDIPAGGAGKKADGQWRPLTRIAFRFCFCYLLPVGLGCLFIFAEVAYRHSNAAFWKFYSLDPWFRVLPWICRHVFHVHRELRIYPDGDVLSGWLQHLFEVGVALVATAAWTLLGRGRRNYRRLYGWFALYLRFCLAITLFNYGFAKVVPIQFGSMTPSRILQPVGSLSLFWMLWTFMAASKGYTIFSGCLEVLAGFLLLLPRMETLGALVAFLILANVVILNLFYNVGVLVFSSHLLFIAAFLSAPALLRILELVVLRRTVAPALPVPLSGKRWVDRGAYASVCAVGLALCLCCASVSVGYSARLSAQDTAVPFRGAWTVDSFSTGERGQQGLFTEKLAKELQAPAGGDRWVRLYFENRLFNPPNSMMIELKNGILDTVNLTYDAPSGAMRLSDDDDPSWKVALRMKPSGRDGLELKGTVNGVPVTAELHREDLSRFPLTQEEVRFIQDD